MNLSVASKMSIPRSADIPVSNAAIAVLHKPPGENVKVLIVQQRKGGRYCFPGGGRDLGEPEKACAYRELKEETGYKPEKDLYQVLGNFVIADKHTRIYVIRDMRDSFPFAPRPTGEIMSARFVDIGELAARIADGSFRRYAIDSASIVLALAATVK